MKKKIKIDDDTYEIDGIYVIDISSQKTRGTWPTCDLDGCDYYAAFSTQPERVYNGNEYSVCDGEEKSDGKPCRIFNSCRDHIDKIIDICRKTEEQFNKENK